MYFAYDKDMNFGGPGMECYVLNCVLPLDSYVEAPNLQCDCMWEEGLCVGDKV